MGFPAILGGVTVSTLIIIFGVYKIFLDKPPIIYPPSQTKITQISPTPQTSTTPTTIPNKPTSKPLAKPKASASGIIGSITIIQNNLSSQTALNGGSTISGLMDISGTPPSGSSFVITARETGTNNAFQTVVDSITPQDSENWTWNSAKSGTTYDVIAVLKGKSNNLDIDYAKSQTYQIKSPAYQQIFQVDIGYAMSTPTGTITITCNTHYSNNTWSATVNFPQVTGAQNYWFQIGTTSGGHDLEDLTKNAQTQDVTFTDSVKYYAQYAISSVSNPTAAQYSSFSSPTQLQCP